MQRLQKFLHQYSSRASLDGIGLVHTANGEDFIDIIESGKIIPSECNVFRGEKLSYFFLGRPAYKTSVVKDASFWQLPAVFCFDKLEAYHPKRVFPFDSGALSKGRYKEIIGKIALDDFELDASWNSISNLIFHFFGEIDNYKQGISFSYQEIRKLVGNDTSAYVALALSKLYNYQFNDEIDDRVRLVEIQYDSEIELSKKSLKAVILCKEWLSDSGLKGKLDTIGCDVLDYPLFPLSSSSYYSKIYELAGTIK